MKDSLKNSFCFFLCFAFIFVAVPVWAGAYYVAPNGSDSNPGTISQPWKTLSKASSVTAETGGTTVYFRAGTYYGSLNPTNSGTSDAWITWKPYPRESVYIVNNTGNGGGNGVNLRTANPQVGWTMKQYKGYYEVNGFDITSTSNNGIAVYDVHHVRILNNYVHDCPHTGIATVNVQDHTLIEGNRVARNSMTATPWGSSISIWNSGCLFSSVSGYACNYINDGAEGYHVVLRNNIIHGGSNDSTTGTDGNGIIMDNNGDNALPTLISNNHIYHNGARGVQILNTSNVHVLNNTLWENIQSPYLPKTNGSGELQVAALGYGVHVTNVVFKNNIVYGHGHGCPWQAWVASPQTLSYTSDYNIFYNAGDSNYSKSTSGHGCNWTHGAHDKVGNSYNPLFSATPTCTGTPPYHCDWASEDFQLQSGSPAIDNGTSEYLSVVNTDFAGKSIPQGSGYDIGAYEFMGGGYATISAPTGLTIRP